MNTMAEMIPQKWWTNPEKAAVSQPITSYPQHDVGEIVQPRSWGVGFLCMLVIGSALAVIYIKDLSRRGFIQLQQLQTQTLQYEEEWGKLLLEQSAWTNQERIQWAAEHQLQMKIPSPEEVITLRQR